MATLTVADLDNGKRDLETVSGVANSRDVSVPARFGQQTLTLYEAIRRIVAAGDAQLADQKEAAEDILRSLGYLVPVPYESGLEVTTAQFTVVGPDGVVYSARAADVPFVTGDWDTSQWTPIQNTMSGNQLLVFDTRVAAEAAAAILPDGQRVDVSDEKKRYKVEAGALVFAENLDQLRDDLANPIKGASEISTAYPINGSRIRKQSERNTDSVDLRDFVSGDGSDESDGMRKAIETGASVIRGRDMTVRFENIVLDREITFDCENVTFKKLKNTANLWKIVGGKYKIKHKGVRIDGGFTSTALTYADDIVVTSISAPGLKLYFDDCDLDSHGRRGLATGYFGQDLINLVNVLNCRSNGQHMPRLNGSVNSVFEINNARLFKVNGWQNKGDGIFINAVDLSNFERIPACSFLVTNTKCLFNDVDIEDECGVILYSGCHHSSVAAFTSNRCAFGLRMLNSRNCSARQIVITDSVLLTVSSFEWSPYQRLGTGIGSVVEEDVVGLVAENVWIQGNGQGMSFIGAQINGGGIYGVQNARAREITLNNVHIRTAGDCLTMQDVDAFNMVGGSLACTSATKSLINAVQSIANGAQVARFSRVTLDRCGANGRILNGGLSAGIIQRGTEFYFTGCNYKGVSAVTGPVIYWRGAGVVHIEGGSVDAQPAGTFLTAFDTGRVFFKNLMGLVYPSTTKVAIDYASVKQVISDHYKKTEFGPSDMVYNSDNWTTGVPPAINNFEIGSRMQYSSVVPSGYSGVIFTNSGWRPYSQVSV